MYRITNLYDDMKIYNKNNKTDYNRYKFVLSHLPEIHKLLYNSTDQKSEYFISEKLNWFIIDSNFSHNLELLYCSYNFMLDYEINQLKKCKDILKINRYKKYLVDVKFIINNIHIEEYDVINLL